MIKKLKNATRYFSSARTIEESMNHRYVFSLLLICVVMAINKMLHKISYKTKSFIHPKNYIDVKINYIFTL